MRVLRLAPVFPGSLACGGGFQAAAFHSPHPGPRLRPHLEKTAADVPPLSCSPPAGNAESRTTCGPMRPLNVRASSRHFQLPLACVPPPLALCSLWPVSSLAPPPPSSCSRRPKLWPCSRNAPSGFPRLHSLHTAEKKRFLKTAHGKPALEHCR